MPEEGNTSTQTRRPRYKSRRLRDLQFRPTNLKLGYQCPGPAAAALFPCGCCRLCCWQLNLKLLFASCEAVSRAADSKIEGWEQSKQTKEGLPKRALQAGSAVSTLVASAMAQGVDRLTPTAASPHKRRATERQARVCGPSVVWNAGAGAAQQCPEGAGLARPRRPRCREGLQTFGKETI